MGREPLVSVVIVFLNAEEFLQEAIQSVFAQGYSRWELLLVDDGSTDTSSQIAQRCARDHSERVRYLEHSGHANLGIPASRNAGIRQASGTYVSFLDADDVWVNTKLEQQVAILEQHPKAAMVYGLDLYWFSWSKDATARRSDHVHRLGVPPNRVIDSPTLLPLFLRGKAVVPTPSGILVRRAVLERLEGFAELFIGIYGSYEDQAFYAKLCLCAPVIVSDLCWVKYRQHPGSVMAQVQGLGKEAVARRFYLDWLVEYLSERRVVDSDVWLAVSKELWRLRTPSWLERRAGVSRRIRWIKKWALRLEEWVLPTALQRRLWARGLGRANPLPARGQ